MEEGGEDGDDEQSMAFHGRDGEEKYERSESLVLCSLFHKPLTKNPSHHFQIHLQIKIKSTIIFA